MNVIELRKADEARGWQEVPESCPPRFVASICEKRALAIQTGAAIPTPILRRSAPTPTVTRSTKSLEQLYFERTGREYVDVRQRLAVLGMQVRAEAVQIAAANAEAERNAREVNAELFPWTVR